MSCAKKGALLTCIFCAFFVLPIFEEVAGNGLILTDNNETALDVIQDETHPGKMCVKRHALNVGSFKVAEPDMVLSFDTQQRKLYLVLHNADDLLQDYKVHCFAYISNVPKNKKLIRNNVYEVEAEPFTDQYYCMMVPHEDGPTFTSNHILAYVRDNYDFSLKIEIYKFFAYSRGNDSINAILNSWFGNTSLDIRVVTLKTNEEDETLTVHVHIATLNDQSPVMHYIELKSRLDLASKENNIGGIILRSSQYCFPEVSITGRMNFTWKLTHIGSSVLPEEICLQENGRPVFRRCVGDFLFGAYWGQIEGLCTTPLIENRRITTLREMLSSSVNSNMSKILIKLTEHSTEMSLLDLYYVQQNLEKLSNSFTLPWLDVVKIISHVMSVDADLLRNSQTYFNITDRILIVFDDVMNRVNLRSNNHDHNLVTVKEKNLYVVVSKSLFNKVCGVALYGTRKLGNLTMSNLDLRDSVTVNKTLQAAVQIPEHFLKQNSPESLMSNFTAIFAIFLNNKLFATDLLDKHSGNIIISAYVPYSNVFTSTVVTVLFRSNYPGVDHECAMWDYGRNTGRKKGSWIVVSPATKFSEDHSLYECLFPQFGHFTILAVDTSESPSVILTIGRMLSLSALLLIFITAILFENWRKKPATKILIQIGLVLFLEIVVDLADTYMYFFGDSNQVCRVIQIIWHYVFLCKICWMLIFVRLQYHRFVVVVAPLPNRIVLMSALFGWIVPAIPITAIYVINSEEGCFLRKDVFLLAAYVPYMIVLVVNILAMCYIMYRVISWRVEVQFSTHSTRKFKACLFVLMFFMLDIPCVFLILGEHTENWKDWLSFNVRYPNATLQGFILFIFYVLLNKEVICHWRDLIYKYFPFC